MKKRAGKARKVILTAVVSVLVIIVALAVTAGIVLHDRIATVYPDKRGNNKGAHAGAGNTNRPRRKRKNRRGNVPRQRNRLLRRYPYGRAHA